ncbi:MULTISPECIES: AraC family transcriptional regulator [unclassified Serratia (in: enterobacteria)]|uniref:AraC family transcriptional regulator n=1 Tax=unclassified Serratia (in: enterobacteria) TaxID=2647522 RepID=UPI000505409E|nr:MULTISPECIES: AraC family transcriptional regulator [unclassified Serratia (in: enterobacteria)]KFK95551.1 AraC family transcriptional regulator [Serratia sp. Ag2]KFL00435.1 AraC family transcriptional regulator [Serratia sp. Ag1]
MADHSPQFWRDERLPFVEARAIADGRKICYSLHSHEFFSIGAITAGTSSYINGEQQLQVKTGDVVIINPQQAHGCNPIGDRRWSYIMFYIDTAWLARLQQENTRSRHEGFTPFTAIASQDPRLFAGLNHLYALLIDPLRNHLEKQIALVDYFSELTLCLGTAPTLALEFNPKLETAAVFIRNHCTQSLTLEAICQASGLSPSYLIRAFKKRYGMTPHAYLVNQRIQYGHRLLKRGFPIAAAASESGFADQAHFQRTFKQLLAATPGQYQIPSANK